MISIIKKITPSWICNQINFLFTVFTVPFIFAYNLKAYNFFESFENSGLNRVDFFGSVLGVVLPHSKYTCISNEFFAFSPNYPIPNRNNYI